MMDIRCINMLGIVLTMLGIIMSVSAPRIVARWSDEKMLKQEFYLAVRYWLGIALILAGTALQLFSVWKG
jgi:hypothetical protein